MATYQFYPDTSRGAVSCVKRTDKDGSIHCIPFSDDNTDYQNYLEWLKEDGNETAAAD